jgi:hypothetical protein
VTHKAAAPLPEIRDTANPTLITGLLMTMLETLGSQYHPILLTKHVRDTVSWKTARKPWRRSPFYLALRVFLQRHLYKIIGNADLGRLYYKTILAIFLSRLLDDAHQHIPHEQSDFLRLKLGRRLSKLELDRDRSPKECQTAHDNLFSSLRGPLEKSLSSVARYLETQWQAHKSRTMRTIRLIKKNAAPADLSLQLRSSGRHLSAILSQQLNGSVSQPYSPKELLTQYENSQARKMPFAIKSLQFMSLSAYEEQYVDPACRGMNLSDNAISRCIFLGTTIQGYIDTIQDAYDVYPDLMSKALLRLMELWVEMDRACSVLYPLIGDFHPAFEAKMFDVLQLQSLHELERLQFVQEYIEARCCGWNGEGSKTIFDTPAHDSFASRYYDESGDSEDLAELRCVIEEKAEKDRIAKEAEWRKLSAHHEKLMRKIAESSCVYVTTYDEDGNLIQVHKKGCTKHRLKWEGK